MSSQFDTLAIDGGVVRQMTLTPAKTFEISVLRAPLADTDTQITTQYLLRFIGIRKSDFAFEATPWLQIKSHRTLRDSVLLKTYEQSNIALSDLWIRGNEILHFQIVLEEGQVDIIAEQFEGALESEIPHLGTFGAPSDSGEQS